MCRTATTTTTIYFKLTINSLNLSGKPHFATSRSSQGDGGEVLPGRHERDCDQSTWRPDSYLRRRHPLQQLLLGRGTTTTATTASLQKQQQCDNGRSRTHRSRQRPRARRSNEFRFQQLCRKERSQHFGIADKKSKIFDEKIVKVEEEIHPRRIGS